MDKLFNFVNESLQLNKNLNSIKSEIINYIDIDTINYCIEFQEFEKGKYVKIKLNDYSNDLVEFILICWNSVETKIHDHADNGCILYLIDGNLEEQIFDKKIMLTSSNIVKPMQSTYMHNDIGYHKIISKNKSISLHIYSPPNYKINTY